MIRVAINGFGRIGRVTARLLLNHPEIELVAVNDIAPIDIMTHLFKYDSIHGGIGKNIEIAQDQKGIEVEGKRVLYFQEQDATRLPWEALQIDYLIEATGQCKTEESANKHLLAGAKKVIISAPVEDNYIKTIVLGVNENLLLASDKVVSNASCTTNNAAPMIQLIDELCGIESGYITTVHSYTGDQRLHDTPNKDFRRARAAAVSIVPTTTGAAKALSKIFPYLDGKLGGCGIRVPVPDGSLTDLTCVVKKPMSMEEINSHFKNAAQERWKGILAYTEDPIVSVDVINNANSCIFDAQLTSVIGNMVKVVGWYDNESGYANRLIDLVVYWHKIAE